MSNKIRLIDRIGKEQEFREKLTAMSDYFKNRGTISDTDAYNYIVTHLSNDKELIIYCAAKALAKISSGNWE